VSQIQIYIDEDAMDSDLAAALRSRGVTVIGAGREHAGMILA